ncbi:hypothetical protein BCR41DRAFT_372754 [Lobosporangium transversale]|uniref:Uncharacterized protein n=1 Tax=Lobosporangium transversale TaxID=64571 RepID=A0A1Y2GHD0_9FUNG|nr:hypothetical protein BCR41DRAFT_372754 [Lobosporangium transversale]ORZ09726.1 hypothetical protein BCR41DRAFT_372754 [Lobosporangium transversale]|eukprot:XP_021878996.1 hypothetical protein BCR41DRAFT_372754 [Lobosporangium transversale]
MLIPRAASVQVNRVLTPDQESFDIWKNQEGMSGESDNFWTMGERTAHGELKLLMGKAVIRYFIEQDRMVSPLNHDLKSYAMSAGNGLDLKVNKLKNQAADLSQQYGRLLDKFVKAPVSIPVKGGSLDFLSTVTVPMQIHELEPDIQDQDYYSKKANHVKEQDPRSVHVLVWKENLIVTLDQKQFPKPHAGKVMKSILDQIGGSKGEGQPQLPRGRMMSDDAVGKLV